jgi:nucleoid-associated protein YgaU
LGGRREDGKYSVGPNDNFWKISERLYGTGAFFRALAECNRDRFPDENELRVGDTILAPEESELVEKYPDLCPTAQRRDVIRSRISAVSTGPQYRTGPTYTVQEGDTLFDIARFKLGSGVRWPEIYGLNSDILQGDFNYVTPGMVLSMPEEPSDAVTRRPESSRARW